MIARLKAGLGDLFWVTVALVVIKATAKGGRP